MWSTLWMHHRNQCVKFIDVKKNQTCAVGILSDCVILKAYKAILIQGPNINLRPSLWFGSGNSGKFEGEKLKDGHTWWWWLDMFLTNTKCCCHLTHKKNCQTRSTEEDAPPPRLRWKEIWLFQTIIVNPLMFALKYTVNKICTESFLYRMIIC